MDMTGELFNDPWEILEPRYRSFIPFANHFWDSCNMKVSPGEHLQICLRMTELISALGLRHVGYGIPTELVGPFANCFVEVLRENAPGEDAALEGFEWSIKLVAKILIRVIQEGSTIVMKVGNSDLYTTYSWKYGDGTGITRYNGIAVKPMVQHIWGDEPP